MAMLIAVTRDVSASLARCELSFVDRSAIDVVRASAQHQAYRDALAAAGCELVSLAGADAWPDAVFVEDVAIVFDELAVMTRQGAVSRRDEGASVAQVLAAHRPLRRIEAPGTLDGGDVLRIGRRVYVGASTRSNASGIAQLAAILGEYGYTVQAVPTRDCLHLKSAVTRVGDDLLLIQPAWVDASVFAQWRCIEIDPAEPHAANALRVGDRVIYPACFPRTQRRLEANGVVVSCVDVGELQKAEGAVTCCSLVFAKRSAVPGNPKPLR